MPSTVTAVSGKGVLANGALPLDQDLLFGRAARDMVRVYDGVPFRLDAKLERLSRSARTLGLPEVRCDELRGLIADVIERRGGGDGMVRLLWTSGRGVEQHAFDEGPGRAVVIGLALPEDLGRLQRDGVRLVSLRTATDATERARSPWLLPGAKTSGSAPNTAAWREARERGGDDAVLVDLQGKLLEGAATNVWWRSGATLFTPGLELGIMAGITRGAIIELAPTLGYQVETGGFGLEALASAEEAFVTSTIAEVVGAIALDGRPIGTGEVGEASRALLDALRELAATEAGAPATA
jgi:branched-subunit amino acid aminotransferase/4-amino-4-deoxychorismate lyase